MSRDGRPRTAASTIHAAVVIAVTLAIPAAGQSLPARPFRPGVYRGTLAPLADPADVAVRADGTILVAEPGAGRVRVLPSPDAADGPSAAIGDTGPDAGRLVAPRALALAADGTLLVADAGRHQIVVFDATGGFRHAFGRYGSEPGELNEPAGIAVDAARVYVADLGNQRIQVFDHDGRWRFAFGRQGDDDGAFNRPVDVAVDGQGFIYVADADNNRIQKFDANGVFVKTWGDWGPFSGLMDQPAGLAFRDGQLYVTDTRNHRIQIYDADGVLQQQWGVHAIRPHEGDGLLHYPDAFAIAPDGRFAVVGESFENRCQIFDAVPEGVDAETANPVAIKAKQSHFGERIDASGNLLTIAEPEVHTLHLFDTSKDVPIVIGSFGERGPRFGQMIRAAGLEVDSEARRLLMSDLATRRVQVFALDYDPAAPPRFDLRRAAFAKSYDLAGLGATLTSIGLRWFIEPAAIERDREGNLYVVDPRNSMILVFDERMQLRRAWGGYGAEPGSFRTPNDIAFSRDGETVFVVDTNNRRIQAFDLEGGFLRAWGRPLEERDERDEDAADTDGVFSSPFGITAGRDDFVYVTDAATHRVQKFTEEGVFVAGWGGLGTEHGRFWKPKGIEQDERDRVIVVDQGNHRAQIFTPDGDWLVTFGLGRAYTREQEERRRRVREERGR